VFGGGEHGGECSDFAGALGGVAGGADYGDVSGAGVGDEDEVANVREGEDVGAVSDPSRSDEGDSRQTKAKGSIQISSSRS
jgi:hypothetical protein